MTMTPDERAALEKELAEQLDGLHLDVGSVTCLGEDERIVSRPHQHHACPYVRLNLDEILLSLESEHQNRLQNHPPPTSWNQLMGCVSKQHVEFFEKLENDLISIQSTFLHPKTNPDPVTLSPAFPAANQPAANQPADHQPPVNKMDSIQDDNAARDLEPDPHVTPEELQSLEELLQQSLHRPLPIFQHRPRDEETSSLLAVAAADPNDRLQGTESITTTTTDHAALRSDAVSPPTNHKMALLPVELDPLELPALPHVASPSHHKRSITPHESQGIDQLAEEQPPTSSAEVSERNSLDSPPPLPSVQVEPPLPLQVDLRVANMQPTDATGANSSPDLRFVLHQERQREDAQWLERFFQQQLELETQLQLQRQQLVFQLANQRLMEAEESASRLQEQLTKRQRQEMQRMQQEDHQSAAFRAVCSQEALRRTRESRQMVGEDNASQALRESLARAEAQAKAAREAAAAHARKLREEKDRERERERERERTQRQAREARAAAALVALRTQEAKETQAMAREECSMRTWHQFKAHEEAKAKARAEAAALRHAQEQERQLMASEEEHIRFVMHFEWHSRRRETEHMHLEENLMLALRHQQQLAKQKRHFAKQRALEKHQQLVWKHMAQVFELWKHHSQTTRRAAQCVQRRWRQYAQTTLRVREQQHHQEEQHAASVVQSAFRGFFVRRRFAAALEMAKQVELQEDDLGEYGEVNFDEFMHDLPELQEEWGRPVLPSREHHRSACMPTVSPKASPARIGKMSSDEVLSVGPELEEDKEEDSDGNRDDVEHRPEDQQLQDAGNNKAEQEHHGTQKKSGSKRQQLASAWGFQDANFAKTLWKRMKKAEKLQKAQEERVKQADPSYRMHKFLQKTKMHPSKTANAGGGGPSLNQLQDQTSTSSTKDVVWASGTKKPHAKIKLPSLVERLRRKTAACK